MPGLPSGVQLNGNQFLTIVAGALQYAALFAAGKFLYVQVGYIFEFYAQVFGQHGHVPQHIA